MSSMNEIVLTGALTVLKNVNFDDVYMEYETPQDHECMRIVTPNHSTTIISGRRKEGYIFHPFEKRYISESSAFMPIGEASTKVALQAHLQLLKEEKLESTHVDSVHLETTEKVIELLSGLSSRVSTLRYKMKKGTVRLEVIKGLNSLVVEGTTVGGYRLNLNGFDLTPITGNVSLGMLFQFFVTNGFYDYKSQLPLAYE